MNPFYYRAIPYPWNDGRYQTARVSGPARIQAIGENSADSIRISIPEEDFADPKRSSEPTKPEVRQLFSKTRPGDLVENIPQHFHLPLVWDATEARRRLSRLKILAALDEWSLTTGLEECAKNLQKKLGAELTYLHVKTNAEDLISGNRMKKSFSEIFPHSTLRFSSHNNPERAILETVRQGGFHWILLATHGRQGKERVRSGSLAENLLQDADCPVLIHRKASNWTQMRKILIPFQNFLSLRTAFSTALSLSHAFSARLWLYHVDEHASEDLSFEEEWSKAFPENLPDMKNIPWHLGQGSVAQSIADYVKREKFDLVVMANHREDLTARLLPVGVTPEVLRLVPCSLMAVPNRD